MRNDTLPSSCRKIRIIGSVGSGKTTFAKHLSKRMDTPYHELDNVVWERHPERDRRRTDEERDQFLEGILKQPEWIIEGVHQEDWTNETFHQADCIVLLDPPYFTRVYRITRRFARQKLRMEKSNYTPTWKIFLKMFKWNHRFEKRGKPRFHERFKCFTRKTIVSVDRSFPILIDEKDREGEG
ncbi:DNA topology modulation protein FlaR [Halobacillus fulvus]|nr:DNA topology modulation protein FlaR [Halobacillus fulvus]